MLRTLPNTAKILKIDKKVLKKAKHNLHKAKRLDNFLVLTLTDTRHSFMNSQKIEAKRDAYYLLLSQTMNMLYHYFDLTTHNNQADNDLLKLHLMNMDYMVEKVRKHAVKLAKNSTDNRYDSLSDYTLNIFNTLISTRVDYFHMKTLEPLNLDDVRKYFSLFASQVELTKQMNTVKSMKEA